MLTTLSNSTSPTPAIVVGAAPRSLAELIAQIGDVPLDRILVDPPPGTATEADVIRYLHAEYKRRCELVDGVLVEKAMGFYEDYLGGQLLYLIQQFLDEHPLGIVAGASGPMRVLPKQVRIPDVSFVRRERIPRNWQRSAIFAKSPDLAVEVLSKSNTRGEMRRKLRDYFKGKVRLVWVIDPKRRICDIHTSPTKKTRIDESGVIEGGSVLPGFKLKLADLFRRADKSGLTPE